jgi:hypothetical protein
MTFSKEQQKTALAAMVAILVLLNAYRYFSVEQPKTAPLAFPRGMVASTPVRHGQQTRTDGADPLSIVFARSQERYPGVVRNIFKMERPVVKPAAKPIPAVVVTAPTPSAPERTAQEIAAELARADLLKFRYLGYLVEKDMTLFLSKDGELFIVKSGDKLLTSYKVKEANKDYVVIVDTATQMEGRVSLSGGVTQVQQQLQQQQPQEQPPLPQQRSLQPQQSSTQPAELSPEAKEKLKQQAIDRRRHRTPNTPPAP